MTKAKDFDMVGAMMAWEDGQLGREAEIELFQHLVDSGMAWTLQGAYGRQAQRMIDAGWIQKPTQQK